MEENTRKYCSLCGMPDPDQSWCKFCRSSYKKARRRAKKMPFSTETKLVVSLLMIEYVYKEGLQYTWDVHWYNSEKTLIYMSTIEDTSNGHPESVKELKEYKITSYYITSPS